MSHGSGKSYAPEFVAALKDAGFDFFAGVPCSLLKGLVSQLEADRDARYISATREDSAIGMAVGAWLGGRLPMVLMQNSGLGVSVNALASLSTMYEVPTLLVISWRGEGGNDAPEHIMMGEIMLPILDLMKIQHRVLRGGEPMGPQVGWAKDVMLSTRQPAALIVPAGVLE
ncbi:thiamine pyrophosphate-binding protein [Sorangium sp. So ce394]|uniref:Sulfopyruvate decarboxylase subunit alpha n=1 Tax=Sorangium cellulosum TaxID=56 RepID=A0A150S4M8_SORCE|nr:sulfopyruvate decarboxylase subunit alpha [Sorangium cellulosum]KYF87433.1 sulfopyruvate decarboxylase subunit alpha [Sorangium cellulosum]